MKVFKALLVFLSIVVLASCAREAGDGSPEAPIRKTRISFSAQGEPETSAYLDFSQTPNVRWSDDDLIAVFDGTAKNQFSIDEGTNTGGSATYSGEVTEGFTDLYAVYPYSAANALSGSSLSVTVPAVQTVSSTAKVDPAAIVSVGQVSNGTIEFKQVCGLLKFTISSTGISEVVIHGNNLAGTATVATTGVLSGVTAGESDIVVRSADGTFVSGNYFVAVLPGTTPAEVFTVTFVESSGVAHEKTVSSALTIARKGGGAIGAVDGSYTTCRHITNKAQLFAWGAAMVGDEQEMKVYLDADIDCGGDTWSYTGTEFNGRFFGRNHKIYNLVIETATKTGLIETLDGKLQDFVFGSSDGSSWDNTSRITHVGTSSAIEYVGLACRLTGKGSMENVTNYAKVEVPSSSTSRAFVGGLVGVVPSSAVAAEMSNCKNYGAVSNSSSWSGNETRMGGIVGQCDGALTASGLENHGAIIVANNVTNFIGGLCGDLGSGSSISGSSNYGSITFSDSGSQTTYLGGCFGSVRGSMISDCHNYAAIAATRSAMTWFGGIAGFMQAGEITLTDCVNHSGANLSVASSVTAKSIRMGGMVGGCDSKADSNPITVIIQDCKNDASVTNYGGGTHFGGIAGLFDNYNASTVLKILCCENTGDVASMVTDNTINFGQELRIGGILGMCDPESTTARQTVQSCINSGNVSVAGALKSGASLRVGGIVGHAYRDILIDNCKNFGDVFCDRAGGDAGSAVFNLGGILGYINIRTSTAYQKVTNCVNTGNISTIRNFSNHYLGGIIGGGTNADTYPEVSGCKNYGDISSTRNTNTLVGGLCGYSRWKLSNSSNFGNVTGGSHNGAVVGDANGNAIMTTGLKVGLGVEVTGAANQGTKYTEGAKTYTFTSASSSGKRWFSGDGTGAPITVTVVGQESYSGGTGIEETGTGGYLFVYTGKGDGNYYRLFYGISYDGISWTELNGGESPMPTYWGFPYVTKDSDGTFWLIGVSNNVPRYPIVWKSNDMVSWTVHKSLSPSVLALPSGYANDTNSFGAMKLFFDPASEQFMLTWHAANPSLSDDAYWESMRVFYVLTSDFETFTPAQKLFAFTGSEASVAQIDASIHYYNGKYYALFKDERVYNSSRDYYKRPRIAVADALTGPYGNPGGALTPKHREGPTMVQSPDGGYWYLYAENYDDNSNIYELYRSTSLTASGWTKVTSFTPPSTTNCRHGCVVPIDAKVYRRLEAAYGN